jgi:hypothetical protein
MQRFDLMEDGYVHTSGLTLDWAEEMLERYARTFPNSEYWIEPTKFRSHDN